MSPFIGSTLNVRGGTKVVDPFFTTLLL